MKWTRLVFEVRGTVYLEIRLLVDIIDSASVASSALQSEGPVNWGKGKNKKSRGENQYKQSILNHLPEGGVSQT